MFVFHFGAKKFRNTNKSQLPLIHCHHGLPVGRHRCYVCRPRAKRWKPLLCGQGGAALPQGNICCALSGRIQQQQSQQFPPSSNSTSSGSCVEMWTRTSTVATWARRISCKRIWSPCSSRTSRTRKCPMSSFGC